MKKVLLESVLVALVGALLGFGANAVSPRGLKLSRNFFPDHKPVGLQPAFTGITGSGSESTNAPSAYEQLVTRLKAQGIRVVASNEVASLFRDPRYQQEQIVFIDARDDEHFHEGHIPGAYQLDYYHPENYLGTILPVCQSAQQIVVYCNGGECEASEHTAEFLLDAHVAPQKLYVYAGGIAEWKMNRLPIEMGPRKSGQLSEVSEPK